MMIGRYLRVNPFFPREVDFLPDYGEKQEETGLAAGSSLPMTVVFGVPPPEYPASRSIQECKDGCNDSPGDKKGRTGVLPFPGCF